MVRTVTSIGSLLILAGCGARGVVMDPQEISIENALQQVGEGMSNMVKTQSESTELGLYPAEVVVSFNVAASGTSGTTLMVTPGGPYVTPATERVGLESTVGETASRDNNITVRFVNVLFASPDTLIANMSGAQLFELRQALHGIDPRAAYLMFPEGQPGEGAGASAAPVTSDDNETLASATPEVGGNVPVPNLATPSLPPMKFMSPKSDEDERATLIEGFDRERLDRLVTAVNARVGMNVVDPNIADDDELKAALVKAAEQLRMSKGDIDIMSRER